MYIGLDIGGTKCAVITADNGGNINSRVAFATMPCRTTLDRLYVEIDKIIAANPDDKVLGIGISCGGPLNENTGVIMSPPNLPGWDNVEIVKEIETRFGIPAHLRNDANACALAEWKFGAGQGTQNMIFLTFGTGMGAGLILNGKLYSGTNGNAGEVGHMRLADFGPVGYGKAGSFEGFCSGGGIKQLGQIFAREQLQMGRSVGYCPTMADLDNVSARIIAEAAHAGDPTAIEVYRYCGEKLGAGLSILIDLFNPEAIVIGSIYERSGDLLEESMQAVIAKNTLAPSREVCRIVPAALGDQIGDKAAIAAAME